VECNAHVIGIETAKLIVKNYHVSKLIVADNSFDNNSIFLMHD